MGIIYYSTGLAGREFEVAAIMHSIKIGDGLAITFMVSSRIPLMCQTAYWVTLNLPSLTFLQAC